MSCYILRHVQFPYSWDFVLQDEDLNCSVEHNYSARVTPEMISTFQAVSKVINRLSFVSDTF